MNYFLQVKLKKNHNFSPKNCSDCLKDGWMRAIMWVVVTYVLIYK